MRKKLLALLMCATMVLGTAVTAVAAPSNDDYKNAETILKQYYADKGNIIGEYDAKKENVKFTTEYVKKDTVNNTVYTISYSYAFTGSEDSYVKINSDGKALTKVTGEVDASLDTVNHKITATSLGNGNVIKVVEDGKLFYVKESVDTLPRVLKDGEYVLNASATTGATIAASTPVYTLTQFDGKATGTINYGTDANFVNAYGVDPDGYINLVAGSVSYKLSSKVADGYWVALSAPSLTLKTDVANALVAGTITKSAAAVDIDVFKTVATDNKTYGANEVQYGFQKLIHVTADVASHAVTFKTDWLSQSNAKDANVVYLLNKDIPTYTEYFQRIGSVYKVSDLADDKFTTNYVVSGTYIFDVAAAPDNAGQADSDTAATTGDKAPKTGDVAPIAALAVVMMGAFGAMVVASKKRA